MNELGFIAFPAIVAVVYLIGATLNAINNEVLDKFIPVICGFCGGVLAVVVFKTIPGYIPAENWLMALAIGIVSGFAATGINQAYKQFTKDQAITAIEAFEELNGDEEEANDTEEDSEREG